MSVQPFIKLLRIEQWAKNFFIFLPLFFSGKILSTEYLFANLVAFFAFSFAASAIYCFNDIYDLAKDRLHPKKSLRPIAAGSVTKRNAYLLMFFCLITSGSMLALWGGANRMSTVSIIAFYVLMNIAYCIKLKSFAIVDVLIIALGFVLRIIAGGASAGIWLSEWIVIMTFLLALFLAFAKRRDDVVLFQETGVLHRNNTSRYNLEFLNQVMTVISTVTIIAYIMYTLSPEVIGRFHNRYIYVTSLFVLAGIIRYLQITIVDANSGSPTGILYKDRFIQLSILGWVVSFLFIIYL